MGKTAAMDEGETEREGESAETERGRLMENHTLEKLPR
jgi:hypothetical protein